MAAKFVINVVSILGFSFLDNSQSLQQKKLEIKLQIILYIIPFLKSLINTGFLRIFLFKLSDSRHLVEFDCLAL